MRIDRLDLIRYGKFSDARIDLPYRQQDFHCIVGPNEAGKSTVRSALFDLLFGFEKNSSYGFMHTLSDLRLGAELSHEGQVLEFHRTKGYKATLRSPTNAALPEDALAWQLGAIDRKFFGKMFSLDHDKLVDGGASILSASDDAGQVLFEAAAGIMSFGQVRSALEKEAEELWSKRRAGTRTYYQAEKEYEQARQTIKSATLRVKDWANAQDKVDALDRQLIGAREALTQLKARRDLLQRVRRVGPLLATLDAHNLELAKYRDTPELPKSASATLEEAERGLAKCRAEREHQERLKFAAETALKSLSFDERLLDLERDIIDIDEHRVQYRAYPNDIRQRQAEIDAKWTLATTLGAQLGLDGLSEEALRARLPTPRSRSVLISLVRRHDSLRQNRESAEKALQAKTTDIEEARKRLVQLGQVETPVSLRVAITQARKLGDIDAALAQLHRDIRDKDQTLQIAQQAIVDTEADPEFLNAMLVPSREVVQGLVEADRVDSTELRSLLGQKLRLDGQVDTARANVSEIKDLRQPVLQADVLSAREARDDAWAAIRGNPQEVVERAPHYEEFVVRADSLADERHDKARDAAELQAAQTRLDELIQESKSIQQQLDTVQERMHRREAEWSESCAERGMPAVSFQTAVDWLSARERVLEASAALTSAQHKQVDLTSDVERTLGSLRNELAAVGVTVRSTDLPTLLLRADEWVGTTDEARGRRETLLRQAESADEDLKALREASNDANSRYTNWQQEWASALGEAGFQSEYEPEAAEADLSVSARIAEALRDIQDIRTQRIDTMQADLRFFESTANGLASQVAPELAGRSPTEISVELKKRLDAARDIHGEAERQKRAVQEAVRSMNEVDADVLQIQATLEPLMLRSNAATMDELRDAVQRSDARRALQEKLDSVGASLVEQGDNLPMARLRDEIDSVDQAYARAELEQLSTQEDALVSQVAQLSAAFEVARTTFLDMAGSADAAKAEAERQEALAKMAAAVERYIKVHTAARLLSWSIEQYREAKQGPMLAVASDIFARLTLGSFERLSVDFESNPPTLQGRRPNRSSVGVEGMSDGTRDQLYLALRLAALEMHLSQAHVLPFVADDLFINFDAQRARAGLQALANLSQQTQVIFLTHHDHLLPLIRDVFGSDASVIELH